MKKSSLIIIGIVLMLTFTGCTKGSSTSDVVNKPSETAFTSAETNAVVEKSTENLFTEESTAIQTTEEETTEKPTEETKTDTFVENTTEERTDEYNAEAAKKKFAESDIPDSIKNIFLSDGVFVDTVTQTEMKLSEYKLYEIIFDWTRSDKIEEWIRYTAVDFDGDGKKELFYDVKSQNSFYERVIFHEHTDGKVYAYRHPGTRESVSENGDVLRSAGADLTAQGLSRYSFDTENIIEKHIVFAAPQTDGSYEYYVKGHWVDLAEYETYFKHFWETHLEAIEFRITPDAD